MGDRKQNGSAESSNYELPRESVHELRNTVAIILGNSELLLSTQQTPEEVQMALQVMRKRAVRAKEILDGIRGRSQELSHEQPPIDEQ